jgi:DUF1680 family protein
VYNLLLSAFSLFLVCAPHGVFAQGRDDILPRIGGWSRTVAPGDSGCVAGEYTQPSGVEIRVELYPHISIDYAFGTYSRERGAGGRLIDIGTQSYLRDMTLHCFCGRYYVKLSIRQGGPEDTTELISLGRRVTEHLHQMCIWPEPLYLFPSEEKQRDSETFVPENFLGYRFFHSVYTARYEGGALVFVIRLDSSDQVPLLAKTYLNSLDIHPESPLRGIVDAVDPHAGRIALLLHGRYLCGATGPGEPELLHRRLADVRTRLNEMKNVSVKVDLPHVWKFTLGDNSAYSDPEYDDSGWKPLNVGDYWENQGYDRYDGIAWYRGAVVVPDTLRTSASIGEALVLCLGKIDDSDTVYFNGARVGFSGLYSTTRRYLVPFELVHWDRPNSIAVRVDDIGGYGGMNQGPYCIRTAGTPDILRIRGIGNPAEIEISPAAPVSRKIRFDVLRPVTITGALGITFMNLNTKSVLPDSVVHLSVGKGGDTSWSVMVNFPAGGSYKAIYRFVGDSLRDTVTESGLIAHAPLPRNHSDPAGGMVHSFVPDRAIPFPYEEIRLSGYLEERMAANLHARLLNIDESGMLAGYIDRPGNQEWVNEYAGKYLSAASRVWRYTHNASLKTQMDRMVDVLIACQKEDGYLGTYLPEDYWVNWDVWGHKYTLIGLLGYYGATGFSPALEASRKIGDLLCRTFGNGDGKRSIVESGPWFGLASCSVLDPMVDLYTATGDRKYLEFCNYIIDAYDQRGGPRVVSTLLSHGKLNGIGGGKAYELLSNVLGLVKLYRAAGDVKLLRAAESAWSAVASSRLYPTGSASSHERFQDEHVLPADSDSQICEGCVTTEWLFLNEELFRITRNSRYVDEMEKTIYNHLLAAEHPLTGCVSYYTPLEGRRKFRCTIDGNCCLASVPRGISLIPDVAFSRNPGNGFSINMYSAGRLDCSIRTRRGENIPLTCAIATRFPESGAVEISVSPGRAARFALALRVPSWCVGFRADAGGRTYRGRPGSYVVIDTVWARRSVVHVTLNMSERLIPGGIGYKDCFAIRRGPQILAVDTELNPDLKSLDELRINPSRIRLTPRSPEHPEGWVGTQFFSLAAIREHGRHIPLTLVPFADAGQDGGSVKVWLKKE